VTGLASAAEADAGACQAAASARACVSARATASAAVGIVRIGMRLAPVQEGSIAIGPAGLARQNATGGGKRSRGRVWRHRADTHRTLKLRFARADHFTGSSGASHASARRGLTNVAAGAAVLGGGDVNLATVSIVAVAVRPALVAVELALSVLTTWRGRHRMGRRGRADVSAAAAVRTVGGDGGIAIAARAAARTSGPTRLTRVRAASIGARRHDIGPIGIADLVASAAKVDVRPYVDAGGAGVESATGGLRAGAHIAVSARAPTADASVGTGPTGPAVGATVAS